MSDDGQGPVDPLRRADGGADDGPTAADEEWLDEEWGDPTGRRDPPSVRRYAPHVGAGVLAPLATVAVAFLLAGTLDLPPIVVALVLFAGPVFALPTVLAGLAASEMHVELPSWVPFARWFEGPTLADRLPAHQREAFAAETLDRPATGQPTEWFSRFVVFVLLYLAGTPVVALAWLLFVA